MFRFFSLATWLLIVVVGKSQTTQEFYSATSIYGVGKWLSLNADGTYLYRYNKTTFLQPYTETGTYRLSGDTILCDWLDSCKVYPSEVDSFSFSPNKEGFFIMTTHKVTKYDTICEAYRQAPAVLFIHEGNLYTKRRTGLPHYMPIDLVFVTQGNKPNLFEIMESNAMLTLLNWQVGY